MTLGPLQIQNLRNIKQANVLPSPHINAITGENASGKSSFLEAIFLLSRGRSFRTRQLQELIHFEADALTVAGRSIKTTGNALQLGIEISRRKKKSESEVNRFGGDRSSPTRCRYS